MRIDKIRVANILTDYNASLQLSGLPFLGAKTMGRELSAPIAGCKQFRSRLEIPPRLSGIQMKEWGLLNGRRNSGIRYSGSDSVTYDSSKMKRS